MALCHPELKDTAPQQLREAVSELRQRVEQLNNQVSELEEALSAAQQEVAEQQAQVQSLTTALAEQEAHEEGSTDIAVGEVQRQLRKEKERGSSCRQASEQTSIRAGGAHSQDHGATVVSLQWHDPKSYSTSGKISSIL